eukprot:scaffold235436_cov35-Tisochrysis_lutea.AAC.2
MTAPSWARSASGGPAHMESCLRAATGNRFVWTVLHKGEFELCLWQDSQLILSYGNFCSSTRCGLLARGSPGSKKSYSVWAPESVWHYNVQGRSATDGHDQQRKKLSLASRRVVRMGTK